MKHTFYPTFSNAMRKLRPILLLWSFCMALSVARAQVPVVNDGAIISLDGNVQMVIDGSLTNQANGQLILNTNSILTITGSFTNNGTATVPSTGQLRIGQNLFNNAGNGVFITNGEVSLIGSADQFTGGSGSPINFFRLSLNKAAGLLTLQNSVAVRDGLIFNAGRISLNNQVLNLQTNGFLSGESELNRVLVGAGYVEANRILNLPAFGTNIAGLGLELQSGTNFGSTIIRRYLQQQLAAADGSINRFFELLPTNTGTGNARIRYFDAELVGNEANYRIWSSADGGATYTNQGGTVDTGGNFAESVSAFLLSSPVRVTVADQNCASLPRLRDNPVGPTGTTSATTGLTFDQIYVIAGDALTLQAYNDPASAADGNGAALIDARWSGDFVSHTGADQLVQTHTVNTATPGQYTFTVTLKNQRGCVNARTYVVFVLPAPTAAFVFSPVPTTCLGTPNSFTNNSSVPALPAALTSAGFTFTTQSDWNFAGAAGAQPLTLTLSGANALDGHTRTYDSPGVYNVSLSYTVFYSRSAVPVLNRAANTALPVDVRPLPQPSFTTAAVCVGSNMTFTHTTPALPVIQTSIWDFGDGSAPLTLIGANARDNAVKGYAAPGRYTVRLTTISDAGCETFTEQTVEVRPEPIASFTFSTASSNACAGAVQTFVNTSSVASPVTTPAGSFNSSITESVWNFGDGTAPVVLTGAAALSAPTHTYAAPGLYEVTLVVTSTSPSGTCTSAPFVQTVEIRPIPVANFTATAVCAGTATTFTNASSVVSPIFTSAGTLTSAITESVWDFGDGSGLVTLSGATALDGPSHTYAAPGLYRVRLTVTSTSSPTGTCTSAVFEQVVEVRPSPVASFSFSAVCAGDVATFTNGSSIASPVTGEGTLSMEISEVEWDFGDGSAPVVLTGAGVLAAQTHLYAGAGLYRVRVRVTGRSQSSGQTCESISEQTIEIRPVPVAGFTFANVCAGTAMNFVNTSTVAGSITATPPATGVLTSAITESVWDFGDGSAVVTLSGGTALDGPSHTYAAPGLYRVRLTVTSTSPTGTCTSAVFEQVVEVRPSPVANFSFSAVCAGEVATFTNGSSIASPVTGEGTLSMEISEVEWDFGDGSALVLLTGAGVLAAQTHLYAGAGLYRVRVRVTGRSQSSGQTCESIFEDTIEIRPVPVAGFTFANVCAGTAMNFVNTSTVAGSITATPPATGVLTSAITESVWDFGDGSGLVTLSGATALDGPSHTYAAPGLYRVRLTVTSTSPTGTCTSAVFEQVVEVRPSPVANFSFSAVCAGDVATFTNGSSITSPVTGEGTLSMEISEVEWDFGDGSAPVVLTGAGVLAAQTHLYAGAGLYRVRIRVTGRSQSSGQTCESIFEDTIEIRPVPVAGFTFANVCAGTAMNFVNTSTVAGTLTATPPATGVLSSAITESVWDFGDGSAVVTLSGVTALDGPSHTYAAPGLYRVRLTVTSISPTGTCTSAVFEQVVEVRPSPMAVFTFAPVCVGSPTVFTNNSMVMPVIETPVGTFGMSIVSAVWTFGDGSAPVILTDASALNSVSRNYAAPGLYQVSLTVTARSSQTGEECVNQTIQIIEVRPIPTADFSFGNVCAGNQATFANLSSVATAIAATAPATGILNSTITESVWDFGDGTPVVVATGPGALLPQDHFYAAPGLYQVRLTVTSTSPSGTCTSAQVAKTIEVKPGAVADFTFNQVCVGGTQTFENRSTVESPIVTPAGTLTSSIAESVWNFGDGSAVVTLSGANALDAVSHRYAAPGLYRVTLTTTTLSLPSGEQCTSTISKTAESRPTFQAVFQAGSGCFGSDIFFTNRTVFPAPIAATPPATGTLQLTPTQAIWDFGDGTTRVVSGSASMQSIGHRYAAPGVYTVRLTMVAQSNFSGETCLSVAPPITVQVFPTPQTAFAAADVCLGDTAVFLNQSIFEVPAAPFAPAPRIETARWFFGDGNSLTLTGADVLNPVRHVYRNPGTYQVRLVMTSNTLCTTFQDRTITVHPGVRAGFTAQTACATTATRFQNTSTAQAGASPLTYRWSFGDGRTSAGQHPTHVYERPGTYRVVMQVRTAQGCTDSLVRHLRIYGAPQLAFDAPETWCPGTSYTLTNRSVADTLTTYVWQVVGPTPADEFTLATTSATNTPVSHAISRPGSYILRLRALSAAGCQAVLEKNITVAPAPVSDLPTLFTTCESTAELNGALRVGGSPADTYQWSTGATTPTIRVAEDGLYWVRVITPAGCTRTDSVLVLLNDRVRPQLGADTIVCGIQDMGYLLDAGYPGATYLWSTGATTRTLSARTSGLYWVEVTLENGCQGRDSIRITLLDEGFTARLGGNQIGCEGEPVVLRTGLPFAEGLSFRWSDGSTDSTLVVRQAGMYFVTVQSPAGCISRDTVLVSFLPKAPVRLPAQIEVCRLDDPATGPVILDAGIAGATYRWSDGSTERTLRPAEPGVYWVRVELPGFCPTFDTTEIRLKEPEFAGFSLGADTVVCEGTVLELDAGPAAAYLWSNGSVSRTIRTRFSGRFSVRITSDSGCQYEDEIQVTFRPAPQVELGPDLEVCSLEDVVLDAGVADPRAGFRWSDGSTERALRPTEPGLYWVQVSLPDACTVSDTVRVSIQGGLSIRMAADTVVCQGQPYEIAPEITGEVAAFRWSDGSEAPTLVVNQTGTYQLEIIGENGCRVRATQTVTFLPAVEVALGSDIEACGEALLDAGVASPEATFRWSDGGTERRLRVSQAGEYWVQVSVPGFCPVADTIVVNFPDSLQILMPADTVVCQGQTYAIVPEVTGRVASFRWSDGSEGPSLVVSQTGTYQLTVTGESGCTVSQSVTVVFQPAIQVSTGPDEVTFCGGPAEGGTDEVRIEARITPIPGQTPPIRFRWWFAAPEGEVRQLTTTGPLLRANAPGLYWVEASSPGFCSGTDTIRLRLSEELALNLGNDTTVCAGGLYEIRPQITGRVAAFRWSDGSTAPTLRVGQTGTYSLTIIGEEGCERTARITVTFRPTANVTLGPDISLGQPPACDQAVLEVQTATAPGTTFRWSNGFAGRRITVAEPGEYWVEASAPGHCPAYDTIRVSRSDLFGLELGADTTVCAGGFYEIRPQITGTAAAYLWSDGSTGTTLRVSRTGTYRLTITSAAGCTTTDVITVRMEETPRLSLGPDIITCEDAILDAGVSAAFYRWSNGANSRTIRVTEPGVYWVQVRNAAGCTATDTIRVNRPEVLTLSLGPDVLSCQGEVVTLTPVVTGSVASFRWSDGSSASTLRVSREGTYQLTVTGAAGCTATSVVTVRFRPRPLVNLGPDQTACSEVTLDAGVFGASYLWSTGETARQIRVRQSGQYWVQVSASGQCDAADTVGVTISAPDLRLALPADTLVCAGTPVLLNAGNPGATYLWSDGSASQTLTVRQAGVYTVTVSRGGCSVTGRVNVRFDTSRPVVLLGPDQEQCTPGTPVTLDAGNRGMRHQWGGSNGFTAQTQTVTLSQPGRYWVTVTSPGGCVASDTIEIRTPAQPLTARFLSASVVNVGEPVQFLQVSGPAPFSSQWSFGDGQTSGIEDPVHTFTRSGEFRVQLIVRNMRCADTLSKPITVAALRQELQIPGTEATEPETKFVGLRSVRLYPNPNDGRFEVEINYTPEPGAAEALEVQFYDLAGRLLLSRTYPGHDLKEEYDLRPLSAGMYLMRVVSAQGVQVVRFVKQ